MILTQTGPQATVLWPELQDDSYDHYEVGGEDERRTDDRCRNPGCRGGSVYCV